ncbi:hypothetical protein [Acinetobacter sp. Root1280]|nr:hypothetical protein [Acinetobacter sp. Root1280]
MSHKKPQRLLTIDQIVKRQYIQDVFLGSIIIFLIGAMFYIALVRG